MGNTELKELDEMKLFSCKGKESLSSESFLPFQSHARHACELSSNLMAFPELEIPIACFSLIGCESFQRWGFMLNFNAYWALILSKKQDCWLSDCKFSCSGLKNYPKNRWEIFWTFQKLPKRAFASPTMECMCAGVKAFTLPWNFSSFSSHLKAH